MLLIASVLLVGGAFAVVAVNLTGVSELRFGFEQMIHARIPWLVLGALAAGCGLGIASIARRRRWYKYPIVGVEVLLAALLSVYFVRLSWLPPHALAVEPGDPFPAYSLLDQDRRVHSGPSGGPTLYIFYRGDW